MNHIALPGGGDLHAQPPAPGGGEGGGGGGVTA